MVISLDKIVQDLLLIIRGSNVSQSEPISKRQLEDWIHQYRATLLKRDLDKARMPNPDYIQEIPDLQLESVEGSEDNTIGSGCYIYRSTLQLPKTLDLNKKSGITYVGTILGTQIQMVPYNRFNWQQYKKFTANEKLAFLRNQYMYVSNNDLLQYINVRGVFEQPLEVTVITGVDYRDNYPIPMDKVSTLKQMILKGELGLEAQTPTDDKNDSDHAVSTQIEGQPTRVRR
jgi:hypothetical protein